MSIFKTSDFIFYREPLMWRQGSQVSMRMARGSVSLLSSHGRGQETRVATREESGILGFPSRRGLTSRGSLECNPEIPAFPGEEY